MAYCASGKIIYSNVFDFTILWKSRENVYTEFLLKHEMDTKHYISRFPTKFGRIQYNVFPWKMLHAESWKRCRESCQKSKSIRSEILFWRELHLFGYHFRSECSLKITKNGEKNLIKKSKSFVNAHNNIFFRII